MMEQLKKAIPGVVLRLVIHLLAVARGRGPIMLMVIERYRRAIAEIFRRRERSILVQGAAPKSTAGRIAEAVADKTFSFDVKERQSGYSLIEMTIVLGILAIGATTIMQVAHNRMEERITSRTVADLSIAAEAAYECYVADECATGDPKGWEFPEVWKKTYLPVAFPLGLYVFSASNGVDKQATITVDMGNAKRAQRVARAFGSIARDNTNTVIVTLRIPGTESAITSAVNDIKVGINDGFKRNGLDKVTIGSATITAQEVAALTNALRLECAAEASLRVVGGAFQCGSTAPPAPTTCLVDGQNISVGSPVRVSKYGACSVTKCKRPSHIKNCVNTPYQIYGIRVYKYKRCGNNGQLGKVVNGVIACYINCRTGHEGGRDGNC